MTEDDFNDEDGTRNDYDEAGIAKANPMVAFFAAQRFHDLVHILEDDGDDQEDTLFLQLTLRDFALIHAAITMNQIANPCLDLASNGFLLKMHFAIENQKGEAWTERVREHLTSDGGEG